MGKATYFLSGIGLIIIAYIGFLSCTTQWPLKPLNYCKTLTPFLQPCAEKIEFIGVVMYYLIIFGVLLLLYSLFGHLWDVIKGGGGVVTREIIKEKEVYAGGIGMTKKRFNKIPTEIITKTDDNIHYIFILQRADTTQPLRNKSLRITVKNNIINLVTNQDGIVEFDLSNYLFPGQKKEFSVEFFEDEYFKYSKYELIEE